ncbi:MAG: YggS family pyridoxal phosphate-dependent enzyme [Oscillospiraceae bacterium]
MTQLAEHIAAVRQRIDAAALEAGRNPADITLVAATKTQTGETIREAIASGITVCGENRVQELTDHLSENAYAGAALHFIGHLQTNKVKYIVGKADLIQSVDSPHLMDAIEARADALNLRQDILLEVNIGGEESKGGCPQSQLMDLALHTALCPHIRLRGIMCIPPVAPEKGDNLHFFAQTAQFLVDIREKMGDNNSDIDCLSMGMSGDYEDAVRAGATHVRVGSAIFGMRPHR